MSFPMNISGQDRQEQEPRVRELSLDESWQLLEAARFGRLGTADVGRVDITPLNIVASHRHLYFRSAKGSKLTTLQLNPHVAFEIDSVQGGTADSVMVRGTARILTDPEETAKVDALGLKPWLRTEKLEYVEIAPDYITGRAFRLGD